nr:hypothetical protein CFP56_03355 [Quercus suber]
MIRPSVESGWQKSRLAAKLGKENVSCWDDGSTLTTVQESSSPTPVPGPIRCGGAPCAQSQYCGASIQLSYPVNGGIRNPASASAGASTFPFSFQRRSCCKCRTGQARQGMYGCMKVTSLRMCGRSVKPSHVHRREGLWPRSMMHRWPSHGRQRSESWAEMGAFVPY